MSYTWLPPLLAEIAEVAGLDAALALAEARGGSRITIPARPRPDHWFARAVSMEAAEKIAEYYRVGYGGTKGATITVPVGPDGGTARALRLQRTKIDAMIREGLSADRIAREMRVHRTTVFRRQAALDRRDTRQGNLFD